MCNLAGQTLELAVIVTPTGQVVNFRSLPTVNKDLKFRYLTCFCVKLTIFYYSKMI